MRVTRVLASILVSMHDMKARYGIVDGIAISASYMQLDVVFSYDLILVVVVIVS